MNVKMDFNNGRSRNSLAQTLEVNHEDWIASYKANLTKDTVLEFICSEEISSQHNFYKTYKDILEVVTEKMENDAERQNALALFDRQTLIGAFLSGTTHFMFEYRRSNSSGKIFWVKCQSELFCDLDTEDIILVSSFRNIDERKKLELSLGNRVELDPLTALYKEQSAADMISEMVKERLFSTTRCAMFVVGIDDYIKKKSKISEPDCDKLKRCVAQILCDYFSTKAIITRISESEFAVFMKDVLSDKSIFEKADELCKFGRLSYRENTMTLDITISVGIAFSVADRANFYEMISVGTNGLREITKIDKNAYGVQNQIASPKICDKFQKSVCIAKDYLNELCMMDEINEIVFIIDATSYDLLYVNDAGRKSLKIDNDSGFLGKKCYELIYGLSHPCPFCKEHIPSENGYSTWSHNNLKLHKRFLIKDKMVNWNNRPARFELFIDISDFENLKNVPVSSGIGENLLLECTGTLLSAETLEKAMDAILKKICDYYKADRAFLFEFDDKENVAVNTFEWCMPSVEPQIGVNDRLPLNKFPRWKEALENNEVIISDDVLELIKTNPEEYEIALRRNVSSFYAITFNVPKVLSGYIGVDNPRIHTTDGMLLESLSYFIVSEISKRRLQKRQEFLSYHDILTGLLNRNRYLEFVDETKQESLSSLGVLVADINGLKQVNRSYGHNYGNKIILEIADLLTKHFKQSQIYRFSGDEFVVLSIDITYSEYMAIIKDFKDELGVTASIGYTWADVDVDAERMIDHADELMLIAKQEHYKHDIDDTIYHRSENLDNLLNSIADGEYVMYLQPKANVKTKEIVGAEALVRRFNKRKELIMPSTFIHHLERENLVHYIDLFIFEQTCKTISTWIKYGYTPVPISLNFSRATMLKANLVETVVDLLDRYNIPPELIEIEITENLGEMERETIAQISEKMRNQKLKIALDDFGSQYTGMSILSIMTFDVLKIDRSMINELVTNPKSRQVVHHVLDLCHDLGIKSVAEGVETMEQLNILEKFGCDIVQGYLFNKPIPVASFEEKYIKKL